VGKQGRWGVGGPTPASIAGALPGHGVAEIPAEARQSHAILAMRATVGPRNGTTDAKCPARR